MSEETHASFWTTLPGILTGLGTLIGAIGGIYISLQQLNPASPTNPTSPTPATNPTPTTTSPTPGTGSTSPSTSPTPTNPTPANPTPPTSPIPPATSTPVNPVPSTSPSLSESSIVFTDYSGTTYLSPDGLQQWGIAQVEAASDRYCSDAQPVILRKGTYQVPVNFLSTASPDQSNSCNGVPLRFELISPAQEVKIHFSGAKVDYALQTFAADGTLLGERFAQAEPYVYSIDYTIQYGAPSRVIKSFEFGYTRALTIIREIELR